MFLAVIHFLTWGLFSFAGFENSNTPSPLSPYSESPEPFGKSIYSATPGRNKPNGEASVDPARGSAPLAPAAKASGNTNSAKTVAKKQGPSKVNTSYTKIRPSGGVPNRKISSQPKTLPPKKKISR